MKMLALAFAAAAGLALAVPASAAPLHDGQPAHATVYKYAAPYAVTNRNVMRHHRHDWRRAHASVCTIKKVRVPTWHGVVIRTVRHCR